MKITAVIMAGGKGERFWPRSRKKLPKQFLSLTNDGITMIQSTVKRINELVDISDIFVVTNQEYGDLVYDQLRDIPKENIILEPVAKNTAPCIGVAATYIKKKYEDAIMIVLPADHLIKHNKLYIDTLKKAIEVAKQKSNIVTIGITPTYPETGYGYIQFNPIKDDNVNAYVVERFVEKPNLTLANEYFASEEFLWNSGIFIWKASTILNKFEMILPNIDRGLKKIYKSIGKENNQLILQQVFEEFESVSIDYGIMEKADNIYTIPGSFGWDDVGSWLALERIKPISKEGNVIEGNSIVINSHGCIVQGREKLIAIVGMRDTVIVDTDDALLICNKNNTQEIKEVLLKLREDNQTEYL